MLLYLYGIFIGFATSAVKEQASLMAFSSRRCGSVFYAFAVARM